MQVVQWVVDLRWQARSWCPNGSRAAASTYSARTTFSRRPSLVPRGSRPVASIYLDYTGLSAQNAKRGTAILSLMFPVSDVIPSKTTPYVTVAMIVAERARVPLPAAARQPECPAGVAAVRTRAGVFLLDRRCSRACSCTKGWLHLLGNMLYLWIFGDNVEDSLGHVGFPALLSRSAARRRPSARWRSVRDRRFR